MDGYSTASTVTNWKLPSNTGWNLEWGAEGWIMTTYPYKELPHHKVIEWHMDSPYMASDGSLLKSTIEQEKEIEGYIMKKLFNIYVIDDQGAFLMNRSVVADDEEDAKFTAEVDSVIRKQNLKYKDVTVITQLISGGIKIKKEEEAQLVKVVE